MFQANGSLDTSFSGDGKATFNVSTYTATQTSYRRDNLNAAEVLDDGSILLAGSCLHPDGYTEAAMVKVSPTGALDAGFGNAGVLRYRLPGFPANAIWDLAVLRGDPFLSSDDRVLVLETPSNNLNNANHWSLGLARFTAAGQLDATYGSGGRTITTATNSIDAWKMATRHDGSVIVTGSIRYVDGVTPRDGFLASYTPAGLPDSGFGVDGLAIFNVSGSDYGYAVAIDHGPTASPADDKAIVSGYTDASGNGYVAWFHAITGLFDPSFGTNGIMLQQGVSRDLALQADGKVVTITTGSTSTKRGTTYQFLLYRYNV